MSKSKIFIGISVSFAAGVLLTSLLDINRLIIYIGLAVGISALAIFIFSRFKGSALLALFLFIFFLGAWRLQISIVANQFEQFFDQHQDMEGLVVEDTDVRTDKQLLTFQPEGFSQRVLLTTALSQEFFYGDKLAVQGKIKEPQSFDDFDYKKYLERYNVYALASYPKILILKNHQGNKITETLLRLKHWFTGTWSKLLPEPQNSLLAGIEIGARKSLPQNVVDDFNATGVSHIIAISGYNITIIVVLINFLARWLGRRTSFYIGISILAAFVLITGATASVVRAAVMGFLLLIALNTGRQYSILPSLFFAAFVMLIINPRILFWDVGFQLSFAATFGIVLFVPLLEHFTARVPSWFGIKELLLTTLSAIVATLPLILMEFGRLSLVAPLVNLLVLPVVPLVMGLGALSVLPYIGPGFAFATGMFLKYILMVVHYFASLPFSNVQVQISALSFFALLAADVTLYLLLNRAARRQVEAVNTL